MSIDQITNCQQRFLPLGDLLLPAPRVLDVWLVDIDSAAFSQGTGSDNQDRQAFIKQRRFSQRFYSRLILSAYLNTPPAELSLVKSRAGKPLLLPLENPLLHFNISHSRRWLALAVSVDQPLGIDIECRRENSKPLALSERYFSVQEHEWLQQQPAAALQLAFNRLWLRKEAALKCIGSGLAGNLESSVCTLSDESPSSLHTDQVLLDKEVHGLKHLNIVNWEPVDLGIQAAIALQQLPEYINCYQLTCSRSRA